MILDGDVLEIVTKRRTRRTLFSNVKATCAVRIVVSASEKLSQHRIVTADGSQLPSETDSVCV